MSSTPSRINRSTYAEILSERVVHTIVVVPHSIARFLRLSGVCRMEASPKICPDLETRGGYLSPVQDSDRPALTYPSFVNGILMRPADLLEFRAARQNLLVFRIVIEHEHSSWILDQ
jgi:hypothetical protein